MLLASKSRKVIIRLVGASLIALVFFLQRVFSGRIILPQYFRIGLVTIHYYGLIMAAAAAAGFYLAMKRSSTFGITPKQAEDILFWVIIGGFIGARLYHVLSSIGYYRLYPIDIFKVWNGGLSIYGAVLGGILILEIYRRLSPKPLALSPLLDWLAPCVLLGQIIGRFGNLFNYEAFGYPTNLPWKMFVPLQFRPEIFVNYNFFHPWFLYEVVGNTFILIFLLKIGKKQKAGLVAFSYFLLYNLLRFCLEFLRIDSTFIGAFRLNALVSLLLAAISFCVLIYLYRNVPKT